MKAILISTLLFCSSVYAAETITPVHPTPDTSKTTTATISTMPAETVWLDVRTAEEFAAGHLPGAVNIPHTEVAARIAELKLDKATPIAIYCKSGRRAGIALEALQLLGYSKLSNLGGFNELQQQLNSDNERQ